MNFKYLFDC